MILFMQQVLTAVKLGEGGMVYQIATDLSALSIYTDNKFFIKISDETIF